MYRFFIRGLGLAAAPTPLSPAWFQTQMTPDSHHHTETWCCTVQNKALPPPERMELGFANMGGGCIEVLKWLWLSGEQNIYFHEDFH